MAVMSVALAIAGAARPRLAAPDPAPVPPSVVQNGIAVHFSPDGGCTDAIVARIAAAKKAVRVQAYSFTSSPIAQALTSAHKRGVSVSVILDKSQRTARYSSATFLHNQGIDTFIDAKHAIAHNKIILIDNDTIITGSFNFSKAAEEDNAENLLIIEGKADLFRAYLANFNEHLEHCERYEPQATTLN